MQPRNSGRVHEQMLRQLERNEKKEAFQRDRFMRFKLFEIHKKLTQCEFIMHAKLELGGPRSPPCHMLTSCRGGAYTRVTNFSRNRRT